MEFRLFEEKGKYQITYFAMVDILGFKNILASKCFKNPNYLLEIFSSADSAAHRDEYYGIKKLFLSDSILMWTQHKNAIPYLLENCNSLQEKLFKNGHLVRGVIVKDLHYSGSVESYNTKLNKRLSFPDHILISPALVKAYQNEQQLREPVIKAEGAVLNDYPKALRRDKKKYSKDKFYFGADYLGCFSYLLALSSGKPNGRNSELVKEFNSICKLQAMVQKNINTQHGEPRKKWQYVGRIFNRSSVLVNKALKSHGLKVPRVKLR